MYVSFFKNVVKIILPQTFKYRTRVSTIAQSQFAVYNIVGEVVTPKKMTGKNK